MRFQNRDICPSSGSSPFLSSFTGAFGTSCGMTASWISAPAFADLVDLVGYRDRFEIILRRRHHQIERRRAAPASCNPASGRNLPAGSRPACGHGWGDRGIGAGGEHRSSVDFGAVGGRPGLHQAGEGDDAALFEDGSNRPATPRRCPLRGDAIHRSRMPGRERADGASRRETMAFSIAVSARALISSGKSLGSLTQPGVKPQRTRRALRSGRLLPGSGAIGGDHDDDRLRRRNIEARRKVVAFQQAEQLHQFFRGRRQRKTSAHDMDVALHVGWVNDTDRN